MLSNALLSAALMDEKNPVTSFYPVTGEWGVGVGVGVS